MRSGCTTRGADASAGNGAPMDAEAMNTAEASERHDAPPNGSPAKGTPQNAQNARKTARVYHGRESPDGCTKARNAAQRRQKRRAPEAVSGQPCGGGRP